MKSILRICGMKDNNDVGKIQANLSQLEGIIACEILLKKNEVQIIYNEDFIGEEKIINSIENLGYMVV